MQSSLPALYTIWSETQFYQPLYACVLTQLCPTLCDPTDGSPSGSSVQGVSQARILEWLPCPPPGDRPDPGIEPASPAPPIWAGRWFTTLTPGKPVLPALMLSLVMLKEMRCAKSIKISRLPLGPCVVHNPHFTQRELQACRSGGRTTKKVFLTLDVWPLPARSERAVRSLVLTTFSRPARNWHSVTPSCTWRLWGWLRDAELPRSSSWILNLGFLILRPALTPLHR